MKYLISSLILLVLSMSQAHAQCGGGIPVYEGSPAGTSFSGCVGDPSELLGPASQGAPVHVDTAGNGQPEFPEYFVSDADTCATSPEDSQSAAIAAFQAAGFKPHLLSFLVVNLADGKIDVWTRTGGQPPNYWALTYTTCT